MADLLWNGSLGDTYAVDSVTETFSAQSVGRVYVRFRFNGGAETTFLTVRDNAGSTTSHFRLEAAARMGASFPEFRLRISSPVSTWIGNTWVADTAYQLGDEIVFQIDFLVEDGSPTFGSSLHQCVHYDGSMGGNDTFAQSGPTAFSTSWNQVTFDSSASVAIGRVSVWNNTGYDGSGFLCTTEPTFPIVGSAVFGVKTTVTATRAIAFGLDDATNVHDEEGKFKVFGDFEVTGSTTLANDSIANAELANMAQSTVKGRAAGAGTGDPTDLTATQATAILDNFTGDSGSGGVKGLVPAPASGDAAANKFLKASGSWVAIGGGTGDVTGPGSSTDNAIARYDGTSGDVIQDSLITISDAGALGFPDGVRQTFNPDGTNAGLNVGSHAGDPSSPSNGDLWYDSSANELTARINGANVALGAGGSGSPWAVIGSWTHSVNVANVDFTSLGSYNELLIVTHGITKSDASIAGVRLSTNNGSSYFSASGDYEAISTAGAVTATTFIASHSTGSASARSGIVWIIGSNVSGVIKPCHNSSTFPTYYFVASTDAVDAVRVFASAGGNFTGGSIYVFGR